MISFTVKLPPISKKNSQQILVNKKRADRSYLRVKNTRNMKKRRGGLFQSPKNRLITPSMFSVCFICQQSENAI